MNPSTAARAPELMHLVIRRNLHPELDLHASWLPPDWPPPHRSIARFGPAGRDVLHDLLRRRAVGDGSDVFDFDAPMRRLALIDGASLRRLAAYCGLCAHKPLFKVRGIGRTLRRQANRFDRDGADFVMNRMPQLDAFSMNPAPLHERRAGAGRLVVNRGYRLLLAVVRDEAGSLLHDVQRRLPRRVAALDLPALDARQNGQLQELVRLCIVPERLPQWDWLF